jgi:hypothetical protein
MNDVTIYTNQATADLLYAASDRVKVERGEKLGVGFFEYLLPDKVGESPKGIIKEAMDVKKLSEYWNHFQSEIGCFSDVFVDEVECFSAGNDKVEVAFSFDSESVTPFEGLDLLKTLDTDLTYTVSYFEPSGGTVGIRSTSGKCD